ncbi:MAG: hypothetical protein M5R36_25690 [Deltaproteobacteria bacterium]|nr:hypothetical protein [Deltaproteobacteria bacterium]
MRWRPSFSAVACGSGDDDDDDDDDAAADDDAGPADCATVMDFLFNICGFEIRDNEHNVISNEDLCGPDYETEAECFSFCYEDNENCNQMWECMQLNCGLG